MFFCGEETKYKVRNKKLPKNKWEETATKNKSNKIPLHSIDIYEKIPYFSQKKKEKKT